MEVGPFEFLYASIISLTTTCMRWMDIARFLVVGTFFGIVREEEARASHEGVMLAS